MDFHPTNSYGFTKLGHWAGRVKNRMGKRRDPDDLTTKAEHWQTLSADSHPGNDSGNMRHERKVLQTVTDFLNHRKKEDKPFFFVAGFSSPHFPLTVPQEYYDKYKGKIPMPEIPQGYLASQPLNYKHLRAAFDFDDIPPDVTRKGRELYYAFVDWFDNEIIGKLLKVLKQTNFVDNTVIIYSTDHGENMGEHGLWWKNAMYDSATHIPLIISWPTKWKKEQRRTGACSLLGLLISGVSRILAEFLLTRSKISFRAVTDFGLRLMVSIVSIRHFVQLSV
jgi:choline-sulfatase